MASPRILVTLATGKQGSYVVENLSKLSESAEILAVTRNAQGAGAKALAAKSERIKLVQGSWNDAPAVLKAAGQIDAVLVLTYMEVGKKSTEEAEAQAYINAAIAASVPHIVFLSVDRGGPSKSDVDPTAVPHFATKYNIERYLLEKVKQAKVPTTWTIVRPVSFMDNLTPDFLGKAFASLWVGLGKQPLQLVSCRNVGFVAAKALLDPTKYNERKISLAGDELDIRKARTDFREAVGSSLPETFGLVGSLLRLIVAEMRLMYGWFAQGGFGADIPALRAEFPEMQDFKTWLREDSGFSKK